MNLPIWLAVLATLFGLSNLMPDSVANDLAPTVAEDATDAVASQAIFFWAFQGETPPPEEDDEVISLPCNDVEKGDVTGEFKQSPLLKKKWIEDCLILGNCPGGCNIFDDPDKTQPCKC